MRQKWAVPIRFLWALHYVTLLRYVTLLATMRQPKCGRRRRLRRAPLRPVEAGLARAFEHAAQARKPATPHQLVRSALERHLAVESSARWGGRNACAGALRSPSERVASAGALPPCSSLKPAAEGRAVREVRRAIFGAPRGADVGGGRRNALVDPVLLARRPDATRLLTSSMLRYASFECACAGQRSWSCARSSCCCCGRRRSRPERSGRSPRYRPATATRKAL